MINYLILLFGVFISSWSSILIRWMGDLHPLIITFYRLFFSVLLLLPVWRFKHQTVKLAISKNKLILLGLAGFFLAMHFFSWIQSLQWTSVGKSIFLESTHPIFALILSYFFLKEKGSKLVVLGIVLALAGIYLIVSGDVSKQHNSTPGDLMAILSAFFLAAYLLIARFYRHEINLIPYLVQVYLAAAIVTFFLLLILKLDFWQISAKNWLLLFLLALGPNLIGHSLLNWASRKMPVYLVNLAMQGEAVLATLFAALLLKEIPTASFYPGALLILIAVSFIFWVRK